MCTNFHEIYVDTATGFSEKGDTKKSPEKGRGGLSKNFTDTNQPCERHCELELVVTPENKSVEERRKELIKYVQFLLDHSYQLV
jgi:adenylylsulfate kinase-like enzyme